ncbi:MAG: helix-turn-helix domain-containing protein [Bacilli bacterium]|nr:helix-turn-helix domain-containing protein [Bacilli bacterium]
MDLGSNIKRLRVQSNLTQKDLADKVNVTYQAVSRWENNEVEPSLATIQKIAAIFGVGVDELLNGKEIVNNSPTPVTTQPINQTQNSKVVIGVCEKCDKPILEGEKINRFSTGGRRHGNKDHIYCSSCNDKRLVEKAAEQAERAKSQRVKGLGWGIAGGVITLTISLILAITSALPTGMMAVDILLSLVSTYAIFSLIFCSFAKNNFVGDWFVEIASWGFVRMPGIIFGLDLDGIIWLLTVKLFLFLLGLFLAIASFVLAIAICGLLSMFVFPFAIRWSYKNPEKTEI